MGCIPTITIASKPELNPTNQHGRSVPCAIRTPEISSSGRIVLENPPWASLIRMFSTSAAKSPSAAAPNKGLAEALIGEEAPLEESVTRALDQLDHDAHRELRAVLSFSVECALFDLNVRRTGVLLYEILGGRCRTAVPVTWVAFIRGIDCLSDVSNAGQSPYLIRQFPHRCDTVFGDGVGAEILLPEGVGTLFEKGIEELQDVRVVSILAEHEA